MASECRLSGSKIQIAFLGETRRTIPRSRPAFGRASRAGLVQDAACGTGAQRRLVLDETEHGAMLVHVGATKRARSRLPGITRKHVIWRRCFRRCDRPTKIVLRGSVESALFVAADYNIACDQDEAPPRA